MNPTKGLTEEEIAKAKEILATRQPPVETRAATGPTQAQIAEMMQKLDEIAALMRQLLAKISAPQT